MYLCSQASAVVKPTILSPVRPVIQRLFFLHNFFTLGCTGLCPDCCQGMNPASGNASATRQASASGSTSSHSTLDAIQPFPTATTTDHHVSPDTLLRKKPPSDSIPAPPPPTPVPPASAVTPGLANFYTREPPPPPPPPPQSQTAKAAAPIGNHHHQPAPPVPPFWRSSFRSFYDTTKPGPVPPPPPRPPPIAQQPLLPKQQSHKAQPKGKVQKHHSEQQNPWPAALVGNHASFPTTMNPESKRVIGGRWRVGTKLGSGAFGDVYQATDVRTGKQCAIKMEYKGNKHLQLLYESRVYKWLHNCTSEVIGVARTRQYITTHTHNVLVMDLLGLSLEARVNEANTRRLSLKTILMIAIQALRRIEHVHSKSYIHRDIKPDNILTGLNQDAATLYLVDFGLAKRYRDHVTKAHMPFRKGRSFVGTARYASIWTHMGMEQSRRDDLESLGYVLVYLFNGVLPWQGIRTVNKKEKYSRIREKKRNTSVRDLCRGMPSQVGDYFRSVRALEFDERPDYSYLRSLFRTALERRHLQDDGVFDWLGAA